MKLVNAGYGLNIEFKENICEVLVLEHPDHMADLMQQLCAQFDGNAGDFILSEHDKVLNISKVAEIVIDPFHIDFNNRKFVNKLYAELGGDAQAALLDTNELNALAIDLLEKALEKTSYAGIVHELDFSWERFFQFYSVRIDDSFDTIGQKVVEYIKALSNLFGIRLVVFLHLHSYIGEKEMEEVQKAAAYQKTSVLMIEGQEYTQGPYERLHIIDKDRCLITREERDAKSD